MQTKPILVLGATGKTGRRIVEQLKAQGIAVREGSRQAEIPFDWTKPETWPAVLSGTSAAYISYYPDLAVPGAVEAVGAFTKLALELGVNKLVLLSGRGEEEAERAEQLLQNSEAQWTILRASWFSQNFSENFLLDAINSGTLRLPVGDVKEAFVDVDDIADVAVAALTKEGHSNRLYELSGPKLLSFSEVVSTISKAANIEVRFEDVPLDDYAAALKLSDLDPGFVSLVIYLFSEVLDGRNASTTNGVQEALGREPRDFGLYASETAKTGIWTRAKAT